LSRKDVEKIAEVVCDRRLDMVRTRRPRTNRKRIREEEAFEETSRERKWQLVSKVVKLPDQV
jgi:hypothetical protein